MSDFWQQDQRVGEQVNIGQQLNFIAAPEDRVRCPACDSGRAEQMKVAWENNSRVGPGGEQLALNLWGQRVAPPLQPQTPSEIGAWSGLPPPPPPPVPPVRHISVGFAILLAFTPVMLLCGTVFLINGSIRLNSPASADPAYADYPIAEAWRNVIGGTVAIVLLVLGIVATIVVNRLRHRRALNKWKEQHERHRNMITAEWTIPAEQAWQAALEDWKHRWKCRECDTEFRVIRK